MHAFEKSQSSKSAWSIMSRCIIMEDGFRKSLASLMDLNFLNLMLKSLIQKNDCLRSWKSVPESTAVFINQVGKACNF